MAEGRPSIPADLRRRVLVEAGHRCAIPTCRHIEVDIHHIVPWHEGQAHEYPNLIALCPNCHRRADRDEIDRRSLHLYKLNLRFLHDKFSQVEMDVLFDAHRLSPDKVIAWPGTVIVLLRRILEAGLIKREPATSGVSTGGVMLTPDRLEITEKGRMFVDSLGIREL